VIDSINTFCDWIFERPGLPELRPWAAAVCFLAGMRLVVLAWRMRQRMAAQESEN
jgi:hypothetical protein